MRLLNLIKHSNDYSNVISLINNAFSSKKPYTFDANIIIILAQNRDEKNLNRLLFDNNFRIYDLIIYEINGLVKAKEFDKSTSNILNQFLKQIDKRKIMKVPQYKKHRL